MKLIVFGSEYLLLNILVCVGKCLEMGNFGLIKSIWWLTNDRNTVSRESFNATRFDNAPEVF